MTGALTISRERFAKEVFRLGDKKQSEAYRIAYPRSRNWKDSAVWSAASRLMADSKVKARVAELQASAADKAEITVDRILREYAKLAFTDLPGIINFDKGKMTVTDFSQLTEAQRACIQSFKVKTENEMEWDETVSRMVPVPVQYVEVKLYSKQAALDKLSEFLGIGKDRGADDGDDGPVYIGFQQNIQNITVVNNQ